MNAFAITQVIPLFAAIEAAALTPLRVAFTLAVIGFAAIGVLIFRKRHQFFDRDPEVEDDFAAARHVRLENIIFVWGALMIVLFCICVDVWRE
jgi:amino acid transporter